MSGDYPEEEPAVSGIWSQFSLGYRDALLETARLRAGVPRYCAAGLL